MANHTSDEAYHQQRITELHQHLDDLDEKISRLREDVVYETRSNEKLRLEKEIRREEEDREKVRAELNQLETEQATVNSIHSIETQVVEHDPPGGTLRLDSKAYIRRDVDNNLEKMVVQPGNIVIIRGHGEIGKSSLLARGLDYAEKKGHRIIRVDFQGVTTSDHADVLFRNIATNIYFNMDKRAKPAPESFIKIWDTLGAQNRLIEFVEDHVLVRFNDPVVLAIDEINRILNTPLGKDLFWLLKVWQDNIAINKKVRDRLTIVIVFSTEPYLLADDLEPLQWTIGTRIEVRDFNQTQIKLLNKWYGNRLSAQELKESMALLGGHPWLTHTALHEIADGDLENWQELTKVAVDDEYSPFRDHLNRLYILVRKRPELEATLKEIVQNRACSNPECFLRLQAGGLARREGKAYHCRYKLYEDYFQSRL